MISFGKIGTGFLVSQNITMFLRNLVANVFRAFQTNELFKKYVSVLATLIAWCNQLTKQRECAETSSD